MVKEVLQRGSQQIDNKNVVQTFLAEVVDVRDAGYTDLDQL